MSRDHPGVHVHFIRSRPGSFHYAGVSFQRRFTDSLRQNVLVAPTSRTVSLGDLRLNRIGLGTNRLTDTAENRSFLEEAVRAGLNFIDTAHLYTGGESESAIGSALAPFRDDLVVATKGGYRPGGGTEGLRRELEQSFERLRTDRIVLYFLHRVDPDVPLEETMLLLKEYRDGGRIADVGLSEVNVEQIKRARSVVPIAAVQNEYNLSERKHDEVVDYCTVEDILFVPFYPLRGDESAALTEIAERYDASPNQVALAWLLQRSPAVLPIPGTLSLEHLKENLGALDIDLSSEDFGTLSAA
jgi:pyridoxine 4-dehydrogenase